MIALALEYATAILGAYGAWLNSSGRAHSSYRVWLIGNTIGIFYGIADGHFGIAAMFAWYVFISIRGLHHWRTL